MSAARADPELLARITEWIGDGALALADLRYEGEPDICLGERANSLIKTTYKALRRYRGCP